MVEQANQQTKSQTSERTSGSLGKTINQKGTKETTNKQNRVDPSDKRTALQRFWDNAKQKVSSLKSSTKGKN